MDAGARRYAQLMALSEALGAAGDVRSHVRAAAPLLDAMLPNDGLGWGGRMTPDSPVGLRFGAEMTRDPALERASASAADDHPLVLHYRRRDVPSRPLRISDVASPQEWCRTVAYQALRDHDGAYQLCLPVTRFWSPPATVWVARRRSRDYTDAEVALASAALPVLAATWHVKVRPRPDPSVAAARERFGATPRQLQVLDLLAQGGSARVIGRTLRISERTVHKHLQHLYARLGVRDRLQAVERARALGLLAPAVPAGFGLD